MESKNNIDKLFKDKLGNREFDIKESFLADLKVVLGSEPVSIGTISKELLFILLMASRVELIIERPISEFLPVNGTSNPILIFSLAKTLFKEGKKVKVKSNIILIIFFILMLL